jgi:hypothetical protein
MASRGLFSAAGRSTWLALVFGVIVGGAPGAARAAVITDAANDFIPSYLGPKGADLDVLSASVTLSGSNFILHAVMNGAIGTTPGGFYVWGFNRGAGTPGFASLGLPNILFDRVVVIQNNNTGAVAGTSISVTNNGNEFTAIVPVSLLPSTGFALENFTWNLWPRGPAIAGNPNGNVADFAPDSTNAAVTVAPPVPEPPGLLIFAVGGLVVAGWASLKRRASALPVGG